MILKKNPTRFLVPYLHQKQQESKATSVRSSQTENKPMKTSFYTPPYERRVNIFVVIR